MGLDMYLYANKRVSRFNSPEKVEEITKVFPDIPMCDNLQTCLIKIEVAYWRKANQIHKWFVDNVQGGVDECQPHEVSKEQLQKLLNTCKEVYAAAKIGNLEVAAEDLPPSSGFFFGSKEIDEYYLQDIEYTVEVISKLLLADVDYFTYQSSW